MNFPFSTHAIYVTLDGKQIYRVYRDFSRVEVANNCINFNEPYLLLHKEQFNFSKGFLLNKDNPFKLDAQTARAYHQIGFISEKELQDFISN
ncbi:hypothetical protein bcgnr5390_10710 [Bacillus luti]|nr:hypothetical protein BC2903_30190 [Bacillus cereus]